MKILAIDTATEACSVALRIKNEVIEKYETGVQKHAQCLLSMIENLLAQAQLSVSQLNAIAFGCGPGSFTGLRIAASTTQALAFSAGLPVIPISDLRAIAQGAYREYNAPKVLAAIDARREEIYWGAFSLKTVSEEFTVMCAEQAESVTSPEQAILPETTDWVGAGNAWKQAAGEILKNRLGNHLKQMIAKYYPHASDIALLAHYEYQENNYYVSAEQALPVYLRNTVTF